jgi:hypothetical protein
VTFEAVQDLYAHARLSPESQVYDVAIGILTGLSPHDIALLMARTYAYPELQGPWRTQVLQASTDAASASQTSKDGLFEVTTLSGEALTGDRFLQTLQSAGHVNITAHGSPSGFALADGSCPGPREIAALPPLVFVAEACLTGDIASVGPEESVALRLVAAGAVAYVGSMATGGVGLVGEYPFLFSTPRLPLGQLVRLQNAARLAADADVPRAILIGDPTFHQFDEEWIAYEVHPEADTIRVRIANTDEPRPVVVALELSGLPEMAYAESVQGEARLVNYQPGISLSDQPLSVASTNGLQQVLLEWPGGDGELILYPSPPLGAVLGQVLAWALLGVRAIFVDALSMPGLGGWPVAIVSLGLLLAIGRGQRGNSARPRFWTGLLVSIGMGLLGIVYYVSQALLPLWPVIVAIGCGAANAAWLVLSERPVFGRTALRVALFLAPLILLWLVMASLGLSLRVHLWIGMGLALTGLSYGVVVWLADWAVRMLITSTPIAASTKL